MFDYKKELQRYFRSVKEGATSCSEMECSNCMFDRNNFADAEDRCDVVNHPAHYNQTQFECIDEMVILFGKQAVIDWCKLTSYKYKYRANYKENLDEDLKKADWYLAKAKELEKGTDN